MKCKMLRLVGVALIIALGAPLSGETPSETPPLPGPTPIGTPPLPGAPISTPPLPGVPISTPPLPSAPPAGTLPQPDALRRQATLR